MRVLTLLTYLVPFPLAPGRPGAGPIGSRLGPKACDDPSRGTSLGKICCAAATPLGPVHPLPGVIYAGRPRRARALVLGSVGDVPLPTTRGLPARAPLDAVSAAVAECRFPGRTVRLPQHHPGAQAMFIAVP